MLTGKKIALIGIGRINRVICAGADVFNFIETKNKQSNCDFGILKITEPVDYKILVKAYRKVQSKYFPEKDVYKPLKK